MPPAKYDDGHLTEPETPRRAPVPKNTNATTPANKRASAQAGATPKSAPAGAGNGSSKKKPEPSLLGDFFLGRQSPARAAAQREAMKQRRKSMAADAANVREELRQEMRAAAVRRLQQPGGVTDRVKAWQKSNVAAMKQQGGGIPHAEDVASEPTEVAAHIFPESVTEEDRVRIKLRQKSKRKKPAKVDKVEDKENQNDGDGEETEREKPGPAKPRVTPREPPVVKLTPKKRIVSDDNWMKRRKGRSPPRGPAPKPKEEANPTPIPKDFLQRTAKNPTVQSKIRDWAERVEIPEPQPARARPPRQRKPAAPVASEPEEGSSILSSDSGTQPKPKPAPADDGIRVKPMKPRKPKPDTDDDGIRVTPVRKKQQPKQSPPDDGIRVRPIEATSQDDGIRVRPVDKDDGIRVRAISKEEPPARKATPSRRASAERAKKGARVPSPKPAPSPDDAAESVETVEQREAETPTPTKRKPSRRRQKRRSPSPVIRASEPPGERPSEPETARHIPPRAASDDESEMIPPTVLGNKSLADIPFGHSAFSELDFSLGADGRNISTRKPKAQRTTSFKGMPSVFKKVVTGAKDIIQEMAEPPRPVAANKPPSIESWLNGTVDPFVEPSSTTEPPKKEEPRETPVVARESTPEPPQPTPDSQRRSSSKLPSKPSPKPAPEERPREAVASASSDSSDSQVTVEPRREDSDATPTKPKSPVTPSTGLKRRRATRVATSPAKSGGRKPFRELLKEAFRGESAGYKLPPAVYPSCETDEEKESEYYEDDWGSTDEPRPPTDPSKTTLSSDYSSYYSSAYDSTLSSDLSSQGPPRRRPPTKGVHELSTIVSEESSTVDSETLSEVSQTTVTQTSAFTKSTIPAPAPARQKSQKSDLKRRLTKHSDLVSVLSLPDTGHLVAPRRSKSIKSSRSLHRRPSKANKTKVDDLLDEFADDEHFYGRELKALVDGVIPVLLRDVMSGNANDATADIAAKSVVSMGMALEKLRDFHRKVPLGDLEDLLFWLEDVSPLYDNYFDVWRLGFQGLIINLAPRQGRVDDDDSLLNALPLNEDGDIVGENGERVDVAFLLKRPLIRVKWMVQFLKAAAAATESDDAKDLLAIFVALQEKSRKRHREETARLMDEDANNTDTHRCRDLRNLLALDGIMMNQARQVAALDVFSLDLCHSSGQRLECQVELIFRDSPSRPEDKGDILIREIGNDSRSWLLFPPVPRQYISARLGDDNDDDSLVVMIRGTHNGNEWFELLTLSTNKDEQIEYWLRVLGSHPLPPATRKRRTSMDLESGSPRTSMADVPLGERKVSISSVGSSDTERPRTPTQHHTPQREDRSSSSASPETTLDREDHIKQGDRRASWEIPSIEPPKIVKPPPNTTPYREDGAPPPPIHRSLGPKNPGLLAPPVDTGRSAQLKRRMSSPLKHEYHPSDISSDSASSMSEDESESSESSSDDLDEDEVPDTIPGYSIKEREEVPAESLVSDNSITPSISASQVEPSSQDDEIKDERPTQKFFASVSYWSSRKGIWKDIHGGQPASIVLYPGFMEVHHLDGQKPKRHSYSSEESGADGADRSAKPLVALVLTPVVMIRRSTALDLEVRSPASPEARLKIEASMFRFRAATQIEAKDLYEAVHISRLNNARYIQLSEEARVRSFGQMEAEPGEGSADGDGSKSRRSWFGRKNSYRASTRAPSVSQGSVSTTVSASSFLRRLMGGGNNNSYNIDESTLDNNNSKRRASAPGGAGSLYTSTSGSGSGSGSSTPPRSIAISVSNSGAGGSGGSQSRWSHGLAKPFSPDAPLEIRCHLNVQNNRWLDKGDCILQIRAPPPGVRQELPLYHGLEKRVIVTHATKKNGGAPLILLDAVLGSKCFSMLGTKGVMCSVWENLRDEEGNVGVAPRSGAASGKVTKWCFQCRSVQQAGWITKLLTSEVPGLMMG
ncbi:hypothetical protein C8A05DRAFT_30234 [Staphylotrichum tortipilum]|uniref:Uncharacterized protein n=1 Tax=Staphylotrichum tortipilum TaxID=2831512 RepID=A0AAN6MRU6_9PEZI|nr:hypothetical protein C8A05DRAFT_30234 [Staphylotrichum longicolle]